MAKGQGERAGELGGGVGEVGLGGAIHQLAKGGKHLGLDLGKLRELVRRRGKRLRGILHGGIARGIGDNGSL